MELMTMNGRERERMGVMMRLKKGDITQKLAAEQLKIGVRQLQRIYKAYCKEGDVALVSKKRNRRSNNRGSDDSESYIVGILLQKYPDFGPTLALEKLQAEHQVQISLSGLRAMMIRNNIWEPKKMKPPKIHRLRNRRECIGALAQMDGSYHDWFEGRGPECCLIVVIDDATSKLMMLKFVEWESTFAYFGVIKEYIKKFGRPLGLYTDRLAVFETTRNTDKDYRDTQFHRAMSELGIELILAHSAPAKGRVERANQTLQDRLVKEMRLLNISTMDAGNAYLPTFMDEYNLRFAKAPQSSIDVHKPLGIEYNLEEILCLHHTRKITKDLLVYWKGKCYQIQEKECKYRLQGKKATVLEQETGGIKILCNNIKINFKEITDSYSSAKPCGIDLPSLLKNWKSSRGGRPNSGHPWRQYAKNSRCSSAER